MKQFPKLIYVAREEEYLTIRADGETDTDFESTTPVAIYKLLDVGKVVVDRRYVGGKGK